MARRPVDPPITISTEFGVTDPNAYFGRHSGVDYAAPTNTPVHAPASGTVWWAGFSQTGGNMVILFDGTYYHRLMHNSILFVAKGDRVTEGQHIANSGSTGLSTGPHVHWDIANEMLDALRPSSFDKFINPADWLAQPNNTGENMAYITDDELADLRSWKDKGVKYESEILPAMDADKQAWVKRAMDAEAKLKQTVDANAQSKLSRIKEIINS